MLYMESDTAIGFYEHKERPMIDKKIASLLSFMFLVSTGCMHAQKPVRFKAPAALAMEVLQRELESLGLQTAEMDDATGILKTRWENSNFLYGQIKDQPATLFRRYVVVLHRRPADTILSIRAEIKSCDAATTVSPDNRLMGDCRPMSGLVEQHQVELNQLGQQLQESLAGLKPSPEAIITSPVVAVFDMQAPLGLFSKESLSNFTDYLAAQLANTGQFRIVPRDKLRDSIHKQQKDSYSPAYDDEFQIQLGKAMAANKILSLQLVGGGNDCAIAATMYDIQSETSSAAATINTACSEKEILKGLQTLARKLADRVKK